MASGIYMYQNVINGQRYIGQAIDLARRKKDHKTRAFNEFQGNNEYNSVIHQAFRKYGYDNFEYSILEECEISLLNERERYWIAYYNSYKAGYNCDEGGNTARHFCKFNADTLQALKIDLQETKDTYEILAARYGMSVGYVSDVNNGKIWYQDGVNYPLRKKQSKTKQYCLQCGIEISGQGDTGLCVACANARYRKTERPTREELKYLIRNHTFVDIGKQFNVTDNAIKKWCKVMNLPARKKDIIAYSNTEWEVI